jgi:hypothetical protein
MDEKVAPKKTGIIIAAVSTIVAAIVGVGAYFSPYLTLNNMKTATANRNANALSQEIDFPSLRTSIKENIRIQVIKQMAATGVKPIKGMSPELVAKMINPMVDKILTPEGLDDLMQDKVPGAKVNLADIEKNMADSDIKMGYESPDRFVVHFTGKVDRTKAVSVILKRNGLAWKLSGIDISKV